MGAVTALRPRKPRIEKNVAVLKDGTRMRVIGNNLLVRVDPAAKESAGGILLPGDAVEHVYNTGTVLAKGFVSSTAAGTTDVEIPGIEPGDRVYFIRYLAKQDTNIWLAKRFGDDVIRLRPADVLLVFDESDLGTFRPDLVKP